MIDSSDVLLVVGGVWAAWMAGFVMGKAAAWVRAIRDVA